MSFPESVFVQNAPFLDRSRPKVTLQPNPTISALATRLETTPPDWLKVYEEVRKLDPRVYAGDQLRGLLGGIHADLVLRDAAASGTLPEEVLIDPIPDGTTTTTFRFSRGCLGNMVVKNTQENRSVAEYDALLATRPSLRPTVCEVKVTSKNGLSSIRKSSLSPKAITNKFAPLTEYFPEESAFGYIVVGTPDAVNQDGRWKERFLNRGGLIVAFPITLAEFTASVADFWKQYPKKARRDQ